MTRSPADSIEKLVLMPIAVAKSPLHLRTNDSEWNVVHQSRSAKLWMPAARNSRFLNLFSCLKVPPIEEPSPQSRTLHLTAQPPMRGDVVAFEKSLLRSPSRDKHGCQFMSERPANIETERLFLVTVMPEEIESIISGDFERVSRLMGVGFQLDDPKLGIDWSWHLKALRADCNELAWRVRVIVERSTNTVVGSINLKGQPIDGDVEIGWGLNDDARGKGYATEASSAVIYWVAQQAGVRSISATVPDDNGPSQRVAARLGLMRTSDTRRDLPLWQRTFG
jgi:[ribosomal protein S5]-alanine N-acetyltransferase